MSQNEDEQAAKLLAEAQMGSSGSSDEQNYKRLAYYLHNALIKCGIDQVINDTLLRWQMETPAHTEPEQEALLTLSTGKQFGLKSLSYTTVFLLEDDKDKQPPQEPHSQHIPVSQAVQAPYNFTLDPMLLGGMIPVQPTHVLLCSERWLQTFYLQPLKRLGKLPPTTTTTTTNNDNDSATVEFVTSDWFVRTTTQELQAEQADMTSKLQKLMGLAQERKSQNNNEEQPTKAFSGAGQALGASTSSTTTTPGVFDPEQLAASAAANHDSSASSPSSSSSSTKTCTIAVRRLDNGQRLVIKSLTTTATVQDLALQCLSACNHQAFQLVAGFPPKPLTDPTATLEQAQLSGAQVVMKKA